MVKKQQKTTAKKKSGAAGGPFDSHLAGSVKESAQQIWLAGMGAFAKAQAEGGKVFDTLVKEGTRLQRKTQTVAEEKLGDVGSRMSALASDASSKAGASWDKLESLFEERTAKALSKLGMLTQRDVASLAQRVEELSAVVAKLGKPGRRAAGEDAVEKPAKKTRKASGKTTSSKTAKAAKSTRVSAKKSVKSAAKPKAQAPTEAKTPPARKTARSAPKPAARKAAASKSTAPRKTSSSAAPKPEADPTP